MKLSLQDYMTSAESPHSPASSLHLRSMQNRCRQVLIGLAIFLDSKVQKRTRSAQPNNSMMRLKQLLVQTDQKSKQLHRKEKEILNCKGLIRLLVKDSGEDGYRAELQQATRELDRQEDERIMQEDILERQRKRQRDRVVMDFEKQVHELKKQCRIQNIELVKLQHQVRKAHGQAYDKQRRVNQLDKILNLWQTPSRDTAIFYQQLKNQQLSSQIQDLEERLEAIKERHREEVAKTEQKERLWKCRLGVLAEMDRRTRRCKMEVQQALCRLLDF